METFRKWSLGLAATLLLVCGASADELQLVNISTARGAFTPLYVRQPTGSYLAQQRGILIGQPIELYEETRCVVIRPVMAGPEPAVYRGDGAYVARR